MSGKLKSRRTVRPSIRTEYPRQPEWERGIDSGIRPEVRSASASRLREPHLFPAEPLAPPTEVPAAAPVKEPPAALHVAHDVREEWLAWLDDLGRENAVAQALGEDAAEEAAGVVRRWDVTESETARRLVQETMRKQWENRYRAAGYTPVAGESTVDALLSG